MEKLEEFISRVPNIVVDIISKQTHVRDAEEYFKKVEMEIRYFKEHGTFKLPPSFQNGGLGDRRVLNENLGGNIPHIKVERLSEIVSNDEPADMNRESLKENIKVEKPDMPPPQMPIKKTRKVKQERSSNSVRSTRSKASKVENNSSKGSVSRDSDVVLEKEVIETVSIIDSDDENESVTGRVTRQKSQNSDNGKSDTEESTRMTRTKVNMQKSDEDKGKRIRSPSTDGDSKARPTRSVRRTKRVKSDEAHTEEISADAETNVADKLDEKTAAKAINETYVAIALDQTRVFSKGDSAEAAAPNETVVVSEPKVLVEPHGTTFNLKDIMTDDEDDDNIVITLPKKVNKSVKNNTKPIFSVFEGSPVKKRVEAFEKLGAEITSEIPVRTTRTKTKALKEKEEEARPKTPQRSTARPKDDKATPQLTNRYLSAISNSASKAPRPNFTCEYISAKSASALKTSQEEFKERENRRREREAEAIKKREAHMQAQIEVKKKKLLEKQVKAQQTRDTLEKAKLKSLKEAERIKEEKHRQILAEKQEKLRKQQEEAERRRLEVLKKAMEEKKKEEERKKAMEEEQEKLKLQGATKKAVEYKKKQKQLPIFLRQKAPFLPTEDCYDSDDESSRKQTKKPAWASTERIERRFRILELTDKAVLRNFIVSDVTTPDLRDIFEYIDPRKLKRTSSAIWKVAPRYTLMPETIQEDGEE